MIINDDNLRIEDIDEFNLKVRAILVSDDKVLVVHYGNVYLLPGGSVEENETLDEAVVRELKEETGCLYSGEDLAYLMRLEYYQGGYQKMDGEIRNRLITTTYYVGDYKEVSYEDRFLSARERKNNFELLLVPFDEVCEMIEMGKNDDPRYDFFARELLEVMNYYYQENAIVFDKWKGRDKRLVKAVD